jgi:ABC-type branched-subunit amino acid transport system ATPase component
MANKNILLEVNNLSAGYGNLDIIRSFSIALSEGETIGLIGPNGSGKSTILKAIMNMVDRRATDIRFNNDSTLKKNIYSLRTAGITYLPQYDNVFRSLSLKDSLRLMNMRGSDFIASFPCDKFADKLHKMLENSYQIVNTLSGGEQRILSVSLGLFGGYSLVLADEPTLGLSETLADAMLTYIAGLSKQNKNVGVILISHDYTQVIKNSDKVIFLKSGKVSDVIEKPDSNDAAYFLRKYMGVK